MKKFISLILILVLAISVIPTTGFAVTTETKIWHEDFESDSALDSYTLTQDNGTVTVVSKDEFGGNALKITSGTEFNKIQKTVDSSWTFANSADNIIVSFDFMVTDADTLFYVLGSDNPANEGNSEQKHEYFCRMKYIAATDTYKLLRNPGSKETDANCYLADVPLNQKNNLTIVFVPRKSTYYAVSAIYLNNVACSGVTNWRMSGIPASTISSLRFAAKTSADTSDTYIDNIRISHFSDKNLSAVSESSLNNVNPYNPIKIQYDNFIKSVGAVTLTDNSGTELDVAYTVDGSYITVTPENYLDFDSSYTVSVSEAKNYFSANVSTDFVINTVKSRASFENATVKSYELSEAKILIDKDIPSEYLSDITFTCSDGAAPIGTPYTQTENGNIYLMIPVADNLKCGMEYTISLANINGFEDYSDVVFYTAEGINVSKPVITGVNGDGSLSLGTVTATITTDSEIPTTSLMLLYYKGNKLMGVSCKTILANSDEITTSINVTETADCYIKVYVVDSLGTMKPLSNSVTIGK